MAQKKAGRKATWLTVALALIAWTLVEKVDPESPVMQYRGLKRSPTKPLEADKPGAYRTSL
ncbi:MAG: hypothetical protein WAN89_05925 [Lawsonella sp.]|nr:hypothetical protein [Mycobacteriales bacterium]